MTQEGLCDLILSDADRISAAISTGAGWEIWMQVELVCILRASKFEVAREVPYPDPNKGMRLDVLCRDSDGNYALEVKVESAFNSGSFLAAINYDREKIVNYFIPDEDSQPLKWVVGIGYSVPAKTSMRKFAENQGNRAVFKTDSAGIIGVLVADVPYINEDPFS